MRISSLGSRFVANSQVSPATIFHRSKSFVTVSGGLGWDNADLRSFEAVGLALAEYSVTRAQEMD